MRSSASSVDFPRALAAKMASHLRLWVLHDLDEPSGRKGNVSAILPPAKTNTTTSRRHFCRMVRPYGDARVKSIVAVLDHERGGVSFGVELHREEVHVVVPTLGAGDLSEPPQPTIEVGFRLLVDVCMHGRSYLAGTLEQRKSSTGESHNVSRCRRDAAAELRPMINVDQPRLAKS